MAGAGLTIVRRVRSLLGRGGEVDTHADGLPRVAPRSEEACALVMQTAAAEGWRVRIEGAGRWAPADAPADLAVTTRALDRIVRIDAPDLVATVQAGITWDDLRGGLAERGVWLAIDPPGTRRTLGSVIATASAGPLRSGFGGVRDHLLGINLVTGDGRVIRAGGRVVKNVAGFDLTKLATGSFASFGIVTAAHLRLRAVPRADLTLTTAGVRDRMVQAAMAVYDAGESPATLELLSPAAAQTDSWILALRLLGSEIAVENERRAVAAALSLPVTELPRSASAGFWRRAGESATGHAVTLRVGFPPTGIYEALDLLGHHLDQGWIMASPGAGVLRWSGTAAADRIRLLRHMASQREFPVTVERAPWGTLQAAGHFGAYREGVGRLVTALRRTFDPAGILATVTGDPA